MVDALASPIDPSQRPPVTSAVGTSLRVAPAVVMAFALAIVFAYLGTLAFYPLGEPDEARYGEIAREMIELGDWATPHLNYVKYFEKPPLVYWIGAASFTLFGLHEFCIRAVPAIFGLLGIAVTLALGRRMYDAWTGYLAAALLAATPIYYGISQFVVLDMPLTALMSLALGSFWFAYSEPQRRRGFVLLLAAATALAVLVKGPVAVLLTGGIIVTFLLLRGDLGALRWVLSPVAGLLFVLIALPWFVVVSYRNPEFLDFFIIKQHLERFAVSDEHRQPVWYFVPVLLVGMLPWTIYGLAAPRTLARFSLTALRRAISPAALYCLVWSGIVFAFFSASGSKLGTYILPMFCPLAILAARFFHRAITTHQRTVFIRANVVLLVVAGIALVGGYVAAEVSDYWRIPAIAARVSAGGLVLGVTATLALICTRRGALQASLATLLVGMLAVEVIAITAREVTGEYRPLGIALRQQAQPDDLIVLYRHYTQSIPFYARRRVIVLGGRGELSFGSQQGDQRQYFWPNEAPLLEAWSSQRRVFLVANRGELEPLRSVLHPPPRQVAAHGKKVVVVNFPAPLALHKNLRATEVSLDTAPKDPGPTRDARGIVS